MKKLYIYLALLLLSGCAMRGPMVASPTGDGKYWVLQEPLLYEHPDTGEQFEIPRGFVTDLTSVPRLFWTAFPPCGKYTSAAVLHDYLYWINSPKCDRKCADDILLLAMKEAGVDIFTRTSIYSAVRVGGQDSWDENKKLRESGVLRVIPEEHMGFRAYESWEQIQERINGASASDVKPSPKKANAHGRQKAPLAIASSSFCPR